MGVDMTKREPINKLIVDLARRACKGGERKMRDSLRSGGLKGAAIDHKSGKWFYVRSVRRRPRQ